MTRSEYLANAVSCDELADAERDLKIAVSLRDVARSWRALAAFDDELAASGWWRPGIYLRHRRA